MQLRIPRPNVIGLLLNYYLFSADVLVFSRRRRVAGRCTRAGYCDGTAAGSASAVSVRNSEAHPLGQRISRARAFPRHTAATDGSSSSPTRLRRCLQATHLVAAPSAAVFFDFYHNSFTHCLSTTHYNSPIRQFHCIITSGRRGCRSAARRRADPILSL